MKKIKLFSLKNQKAFDFISQKAIRFSCRFFSILLVKIPDDHVSSGFDIITKKKTLTAEFPIFYGFKISKKIGKAHERNLLKRRLKNIYLKFFQQNYSKSAIIFIPKKPIKDLNFTSLESEMTRAINWCLRKIISEDK